MSFKYMLLAMSIHKSVCDCNTSDILIKLNKVDGHFVTYWHHVTQTVVPTFFSIHKLLERNQSRQIRIILLTDKIQHVQKIIDRHGWFKIFRQYASVSVLSKYTKTPCTHGLNTQCDPLFLNRTSLQEINECKIVYGKLRESIFHQFNIPIINRKIATVLVILREPWNTQRLRRISNLQEMLTEIILKSQYAGARLVIRSFENTTLVEQLTEITAADVIILQRGSAMANLIMAKPNSTVVHLTSYSTNEGWWTPFYNIPMKYTSKFVRVTGRNFDKFVSVDMKGLREVLGNMLPSATSKFTKFVDFVGY